MYGLWIHNSRPKSKRVVSETIKCENHGRDLVSSAVTLESTSIIGGYDGPLDRAPVGDYVFVGPDPYSARNFYGTITVHSDGRITVK